MVTWSDCAATDLKLFDARKVERPKWNRHAFSITHLPELPPNVWYFRHFTPNLGKSPTFGVSVSAWLAGLSRARWWFVRHYLSKLDVGLYELCSLANCTLNQIHVDKRTREGSWEESDCMPQHSIYSRLSELHTNLTAAKAETIDIWWRYVWLFPILTARVWDKQIISQSPPLSLSLLLSMH